MDEVKLPDIPIILITSTRTEYAERTIDGIRKNLYYDGRIFFYIAADNSNDSHMNKVKHEISCSDFDYDLQQTTAGYGAAANEAWRELSERGYPITFWLEDDWELQRPLDITADVLAMLELEHVGCIRYSYLPTGLEGDVVGHHRTYLQIRKTAPYAFSGNPHLKHERFKFYGAYPEGMNPGDTEIHYDGQIRMKPNEGPSIWWPLDNGDYPGPFHHIGDERSY